MKQACHVLGCIFTVLSLWLFALVLVCDPLQHATRYITMSRLISIIATAWAWARGWYTKA